MSSNAHACTEAAVSPSLHTSMETPRHCCQEMESIGTPYCHSKRPRPSSAQTAPSEWTTNLASPPESSTVVTATAGVLGESPSALNAETATSVSACCCKPLTDIMTMEPMPSFAGTTIGDPGFLASNTAAPLKYTWKPDSLVELSMNTNLADPAVTDPGTSMSPVGAAGGILTGGWVWASSSPGAEASAPVCAWTTT